MIRVKGHTHTHTAITLTKICNVPCNILRKQGFAGVYIIRQSSGDLQFLNQFFFSSFFFVYYVPFCILCSRGFGGMGWGKKERQLRTSIFSF